ncbi:hypothetical protein [Komagataeibacter xylinus]|uniref:hypothetical protein n=1 Tax=Komagataeibacter xylinus TaxID=28448 RepID=UPI0011B7DD72|nr:hypothetical protein [Komagataeibacter xylinus]
MVSVTGACVIEMLSLVVKWSWRWRDRQIHESVPRRDTRRYPPPRNGGMHARALHNTGRVAALRSFSGWKGAHPFRKAGPRRMGKGT